MSINEASVEMMPSSDWTVGGKRIFFQRCSTCQHTWYFHRDFCPACGHDAPAASASAGLGVVHASTLIQRAPSDEFRAIAPYRIVLVDVAEGFRMMAHGHARLAIGDRVRCDVRHLAGRLLPFFDKEPS